MCEGDPQAQQEHSTPELDSNGSSPRPLGSTLWTIGAIVLLVFAGYLPALNADFAITDDRAVVRNPRLTAPDGLRRIWFSTESEQYQPLTYTSFWLERRVWGLRAEGYHLVNIVLHAANAVLVWLLLSKIGVRGAALAALLFALHPVNVESVAWIYERKNVLSGLFVLLTFLALFRFDEKRRWRWYGIALALFAAALLTKASTVVAPAVLLLYWWWRRTLWNRTNIAAAIPLLVLAAIMSVVTIWYEPQYVAATGVEDPAGLWERFARAGWIIAFYAGKALVPHNLMFFYPRWSVDSSAWLSYVPHAVIAGVLIVLFVRRGTWGRGMLFGVGSYLIALFPVLGFFDIFYHQHSFVADHFQYLALIALIALCVHVVSFGLDRIRLPWIGAAASRMSYGGRTIAVLVVAVCWILSWQRVHVFHNTRTICADTIRRSPDCWIAHAKLGAFILRSKITNKQQLKLALHHFEEAGKLNPTDAKIFHNMGLALQMLGRPAKGLDCFGKAVAVEPDSPYHQAWLGKALLQSGRYEEGFRHLREAVRLSPEDRALATLVQEAERKYRRQLNLSP